MRIHTSHFEPMHVPEVSLFTHLFPDVDPFPGDTPAFIDADTGRTVTRQQLREGSMQLGWSMRNNLVKLGGVPLKKGDTVMIFSPNSIAYPIALHGSIAAGLRVTLANSSYTPPELAHQYHDSTAKVIFVHPALLDTVMAMYKHIKVGIKEAKKRIIVMDFGLEEKAPKGLMKMTQLFGKGQLVQEERFDGEHSNETVLLCYSSGTTGKPKGVESTHKNMTAVLRIITPVLSAEHGKDRTLAVLPFYHIYGAVDLLQYPIQQGVPVIVMSKFDPEAFCQNIEKHQITFGLIVPPILVVLTRHPAAEKYNLKSLRLLVSGAAPLGGPLVSAVQSRLRSFGNDTAIVQGYGLTETSPTAHFVPVHDAERKVGYIGKLLANLEARLVVNDGERDAEEGEAGELWLRGPTVMKGYLNNPAATKASITEDGWFKTGDVAIVDKEGYYMIVDRQKELIKYKGFQVPPAELESVLLTHPEIADAGVVGVESVTEATELPRAYVVHAKGLPTNSEKDAFSKHVQEWIGSRVAKHKFLRGGVIIIDAIPKSAAGKILRRELRERAKKEPVVEEGYAFKAKL
ncbi:AMP binding protein [Schizopora paradoxa]|uniref:AMP binding protein n=1 Tax=Schizopora paradoxa TaxID=27342 RepID=A0A0H2SNH4_9AGAM|nr:AMP binding protein [Schizopora paradoxa]